MYQTLKSIAIIFCLSLSMTGCSTLMSGYDSVSDSVAGWFKSDEAKK